MKAQGGKYLTFFLKNEEYGIPILKVKEIIGMMDITCIPKTPAFIKGVINLRGKIIPIMDLRLKFDMEEELYDERTCIIVTEIDTTETTRQMGIVVDTVSEVINVQEGDIEPSPRCGDQWEDKFLAGIGKLKDKVVMLLDIDKVLDKNEINLVEDVNRRVENA